MKSSLAPLPTIINFLAGSRLWSPELRLLMWWLKFHNSWYWSSEVSPRSFSYSEEVPWSLGWKSQSVELLWSKACFAPDYSKQSDVRNRLRTKTRQGPLSLDRILFFIQSDSNIFSWEIKTVFYKYYLFSIFRLTERLWMCDPRVTSWRFGWRTHLNPTVSQGSGRCWKRGWG